MVAVLSVLVEQLSGALVVVVTLWTLQASGGGGCRLLVYITCGSGLYGPVVVATEDSWCIIPTALLSRPSGGG